MQPAANSPVTSTNAAQSAKTQKARLWRHIILFGLAGGIVITLLKLTEYRFLVVEHSIEIYGGLTAATFAAFGIWLGLRLTRKQIVLKEVRIPVPVGQPFAVNSKKLDELEITPRELEILELIAKGLSNREIAEKLFVSENTVKTHSSRVFDKLGAKRRTQAVQLGKEFGLIA
ncbi:MAG TPA: response regulator transcription factor [Candidatus Acidoferrales bacterium]